MYKESTMLPFVFKWPSYSSVYSYTKLYYKHNEKSILYLLYKQVQLSRIVQLIMHQQKDAFCQIDFHKLHAHFFPLLEYTCCMVGLGLSSFMTDFLMCMFRGFHIQIVKCRVTYLCFSMLNLSLEILVSYFVASH